MKTDKWQIRISLLTLILTPIASAGVVYFQLEKSHSYWVKQQSYTYEQKLSEKKFDLYEKLAVELGRLSLLLRDQQVFLYSKNQCVFMLEHVKKKANVNDKYLRSEHERYKALVIEQNARINECLSRINGYNYLGKLYFGEQYEKEVLLLANALKDSRQQLIPLEEMIKIGNESIQKGNPPNETMDKIFVQRGSTLHLDQSISKFLTFIFGKIKEINKV